MKSMKVLIFGNGRLGKELARTQPWPDIDAYVVKRSDVDIRKRSQFSKLVDEFMPDIVINAAANTNVDYLESHEGEALGVNAFAPTSMAHDCQLYGIPFIHYSTDYVFDGESNVAYLDDSIQNPINVYGRSKMLSEKYVLERSDACIVLRTSWLYDGIGDDFVTKILNWARGGKVRVVEDQISNPTWVGDLARMTWELVYKEKISLGFIAANRGIYNCAAAGYVSRYEWAKAILEIKGIDAEVIPAKTADFPTPARRPLFTALDCTRFSDVFCMKPMFWKDALRECLGGLDD